MPPEPRSDWPAIGARVSLARRTAGLAIAQLADRVEIEPTALERIEAGNRNLSATELAALAQATDLPIDWFVLESPPTVASRRATNLRDTTIIDVRADVLTREVSQLVALGLLRVPGRRPALAPPGDVEAAEAAATSLRARLDIDPALPIDLTAAAVEMGLLAYSLDIPGSDADGAYVAVSDDLGIALLNGLQPSARRRFSLAHEIGHHVFQDAYAVDIETGRPETERLIDAFAIHFLLPRAALDQRWADLGGRDKPRAASITIGAEYRLSWTALCGHLVNVGLLDHHQAEIQRELLPRTGEYAALGVGFSENLVPPSVPEPVVTAALRGYRGHVLGAGRTIELLHGALEVADLPARDVVPLAALAGELGR